MDITDTPNCGHCDTLLRWSGQAYLDADGTRGVDHRHAPARRPFAEVARLVHGAEYDEPIPGDAGYRRPNR